MSEQINQPQAPPSNYLVFAILATIFCSKIIGIVSIVFAAQVNSKWNAGDFEGAVTASKNAKLWAWISVSVGVAIVIIMGMLTTFGILAGISLGGLQF